MSHALPVTALTRWEVRRAIRLGVPSDFRIAAQGARHSDGAIATVYVRDGREATGAAHARLIAAAPELRDALSGLVYLLDLAYEAWGSHGPTLTPERIAAARALLDRVDGDAA